MKRILTLLAFIATAAACFAVEPPLTVANGVSYQIRNRKTGDLLRPRDASNRDGTPIVIYPGQPWKCMIWHLTDDGKKGFRLQNQFTAKSFGAGPAVEGKPTAVLQVSCAKDASNAPGWSFSKQEDGSYRIGKPGTDQVLTAVDGAGVTLSTWRNSDEQKWELLKAPEKPTM